LGLPAEARKTAAVLGHNYPGSEWYIDSYEMMENKKVRVSGSGAGSGQNVSIESKQDEKPSWYEVWKMF